MWLNRDELALIFSVVFCQVQPRQVLQQAILEPCLALLPLSDLRARVRAPSFHELQFACQL